MKKKFLRNNPFYNELSKLIGTPSSFYTGIIFFMIRINIVKFLKIIVAKDYSVIIQFVIIRKNYFRGILFVIIRFIRFREENREE